MSRAASNTQVQHTLAGLAIPPYDYEIHTYTGADPTLTVYRQGGAAGRIVAQVARTFDGSGRLLTQTLTLS